MRFGIDAIPLATPKTGIGHYTFELARELARAAPESEVELVSPFPILADEAAAWPPNLQTERVPVNSFRKHWWTIGLPLYVKRAAYALFHGTNFNVPLWNRCPTVVTIHDLSLLLHPETHEEHLVRRARRRLPVMARAATQIITPSASVKREVCERLKIDAGKIVAVPEAPRGSFRPAAEEETLETRRRLGVAADFILFVGTIEPRKNLVTLARAYAEILRATPLRPQLVIAGKEGWLTDELFAVVKETGIGERLRFTGYVSEDDLRALYSSCRVCVYPSLYEGFGLPPLEAMACGAPVVTTRIPSLMETVGEAARLVEPTGVQELARALVSLLSDEQERAHLSAAGLARAAQFSWAKTAQATLEVYRQAIARHAHA